MEASSPRAIRAGSASFLKSEHIEGLGEEELRALLLRAARIHDFDALSYYRSHGRDLIEACYVGEEQILPAALRYQTASGSPPDPCAKPRPLSLVPSKRSYVDAVALPVFGPDLRMCGAIAAFFNRRVQASSEIEALQPLAVEIERRLVRETAAAIACEPFLLDPGAGPRIIMPVFERCTRESAPVSLALFQFESTLKLDHPPFGGPRDSRANTDLSARIAHVQLAALCDEQVFLLRASTPGWALMFPHADVEHTHRRCSSLGAELDAFLARWARESDAQVRYGFGVVAFPETQILHQAGLIATIGAAQSLCHAALRSAPVGAGIVLS